MILPRSFHIMTKPVGPLCNLDCHYCYYLKKESLFQTKDSAHAWTMSDSTLEAFTKNYIHSQPLPRVEFVWQGGEPTLAGMKFFERAIHWQRKYADGKQVENAIQTNGTLLTSEWCRFFAENQFLVGVSIDGPESFHDGFRTDKRGRPTHAQVMEGIGLLNKHGVEFNTLTCVHSQNVTHPLEVYEFLKSIGSRHLQFIPLVPDVTAPNQSPSQNPNWAVDPLLYGEFLCAIFDSWIRKDVGQIYVQMFDVALEAWLGLNPSLCVFSPTCGRAVALEHNGDLFSCDHFVCKEHKIGNVHANSLYEMLESEAQLKFGSNKKNRLPTQCLKCPVLFACNGGCPKDRTQSNDGDLNYLCAGYYRFFTHVDKPMRYMAQKILSGRAPAEIMREFAEPADGPNPF